MPNNPSQSSVGFQQDSCLPMLTRIIHRTLSHIQISERSHGEKVDSSLSKNQALIS